MADCLDYRSRAMVLVIFAIGLLNVCVGYMLAVHLGYGPSGTAAQQNAGDTQHGSAIPGR